MKKRSTTSSAFNGTEVRCATCGGAGLLRNDAAATWNVTHCTTCNGYGKLLLQDKKPVAYTNVSYRNRGIA